MPDKKKKSDTLTVNQITHSIELIVITITA
jgi:hypothetical protein